MKTFRFKKIDAFAQGKSFGNPAGAIYLNSFEDISEIEMQRIAGELKGFVSEVGYICRLDDQTFGLRYYSSEREVEFCGHATIGIMHDVIKNDSELLSKKIIYIKTNKGVLPVSNRITGEDAVFVSAPQPLFFDKKVSILDIADSLRTDACIIDKGYPVSIVNAGLNTLIVPIKTLDNILSVSPDIEELKKFCIGIGVDIITLFSTETSDAKNTFRTRVFAPTFGYLEDPATGSGNSAFGYYLRKNGICLKDSITLEQNDSFKDANIVKLEFSKNTAGDVQVSFGGSAVVRISGEYCLL